ncbi:MAG: GTPase domain-containing protein [Promethearchaeota archaeon]
MIMDYATNTIQVKIVYYGCAMSGKTTSLRYIFRYFNKEEELTSIETTTGRTLFFDFGALEFAGNTWNVKIMLYSATGQDFYASTRPATLHGVDGIVFVVDSQQEFLEDNLRSWNELCHYFSPRLTSIPVVVCFNKWDLRNKIEPDEFLEKIPGNEEELTTVKTVACTGQGVLEAFDMAVHKVLGISLLGSLQQHQEN